VVRIRPVTVPLRRPVVLPLRRTDWFTYAFPDLVMSWTLPL
jgi:hypothetical protein